MTTPTSGPGPMPPKEPIKGPGKPANQPKPLGPSNQKDAALLNSPFAKMFKATGAMPTAKEIQAIINGILKQQVSAIKKSDEKWKKAMRKFKRTIEGND